MRTYTSPRGASVPLTDDNAVYVFSNGVAVSVDHDHTTYFYLPTPFKRGVMGTQHPGPDVDSILRSLGGERVHTGAGFAHMYGIGTREVTRSNA